MKIQVYILFRSPNWNGPTTEGKQANHLDLTLTFSSCRDASRMRIKTVLPVNTSQRSQLLSAGLTLFWRSLAPLKVDMILFVQIKKISQMYQYDRNLFHGSQQRNYNSGENSRQSFYSQIIYSLYFFYFSKMFISLGNFLICSYSDKFLYGHLRAVWSSLKCFLILIFTPKYS